MAATHPPICPPTRPPVRPFVCLSTCHLAHWFPRPRSPPRPRCFTRRCLACSCLVFLFLCVCFFLPRPVSVLPVGPFHVLPLSTARLFPGFFSLSPPRASAAHTPNLRLILILHPKLPPPLLTLLNILATLMRRHLNSVSPFTFLPPVSSSSASSPSLRHCSF